MNKKNTIIAILVFLAILVGSFLIYTHKISQQESSLKKISEDSRFRYYEGSTEVSGEYVTYRDNLLFLGGQFCFNVDDATSSSIPRENGDTRAPWFCFSNKEDALNLLDIDESIFDNQDICFLRGDATILVSEYVVDTSESEVWDEAKLGRVISKTAPASQNCSEEDIKNL